MILQTAIGLALVGFSGAAQLAFIVLVARASLALGRAVGEGGAQGLTVAVALRAVLPGHGWTRALALEDVKHVVQFGRRIRFALLLVVGVHALTLSIVWLIATQ
jgi:hypothetical protein